MQNSNLTIQKREFIGYKLLNSFFGGISMGTVFIIYSELNPSVFSIGGIALAIGLLIVAKLYTKILNIDTFYKISMLVEIVMLFAVIYFLLFPYNYTTALLVYIGYQFTFVFGGYLIRAETVFLNRPKLLSFIDVAKQKGYLAGMFFAYIFYKILEFINITSNQEHVYNIHLVLLLLQISIISLLQKSFTRMNNV